MSLESALARSVVAPPVRSNEVRQRARRHFIDTLGVILSGTRERCVRAVVACAADVGSATGSVRSLVSTKQMSARDAALCNGVAGHAHDFDDDEPHVIVGHPSVAVVAALMAVAGRGPVTFGTLLDAYAVGSETMLRIGPLVNPQHYNAGWHCTATLGVLGAAAACASALSLSHDQVANALNIATTFASGLRENFGTDGKALQVGAAAANGLWACDLAINGLRGAESAISGRQGFVAMNHGRDGAEAASQFGRPWGLEAPGFNVKIYPCCSSTHTALDAIFELLADTAWSADDIETVDVWVGEDVPGILIHDTPRTGLEGKFSMRYCMAYAALHREIALAAFTDDAVREPWITSMMQRVRVHIDHTLPRAATGVTHQSRVQLTSRTGQRVELSHSVPIGSADRPCSADQLRHKFLDCVTHGLNESAAKRIWASVDALSDLELTSSLLDAIHDGVAQ